MFDGLLVTLLKSHIDDGVKDDAAPIDNVEEDAQTWLFEAFVKLEFKKYMKLSQCKSSYSNQAGNDCRDIGQDVDDKN